MQKTKFKKKNYQFCQIALQTYCATSAKVLSAFPKLGSWPLPSRSHSSIPAFSIWSEQHGSTGQNEIGCGLRRFGSGRLCSAGTWHLPVQPRSCFCWAAHQLASPASAGSTRLPAAESSEFSCHAWR